MKTIEELFNEPINPEAIRAILAQNGQDGSEFYRIETPAGPRLYPRVTSVLDAVGRPWLARWVAKEEQGAFRAAAVAQLLSTGLGDGPLIARDAAVVRIEGLRPGSPTEAIKQTAAAFGSKLHGMVERYLKDGEVPVLPAADPHALAFGKWRAWWSAAGLSPVMIEERVSCAACGVGGTLDLLARNPAGRLIVVDLKTSKRISDEYGLQLSAYSHCVARRLGEPVDEAWICRVPKTPGGRVEERRYDAGELAASFAAFTAALVLWRWQKQAAEQDYGDEPVGVH